MATQTNESLQELRNTFIAKGISSASIQGAESAANPAEWIPESGAGWS